MDLSRIPVVVGAGQVTNREQDPASAPDPFMLMQVAARAAASGLAHDALRDLTHLWMVHSLSLRHATPVAYLAQSLGATNAETRCSGMGGSIPQWLVDRACELVLAGASPRILVVGAEALATRKRAKRAGVRLEWPSSEGWPDTWPPIEPDLGVHPIERAHGLDQATAMYALVETAVAHSAAESPADHERSMAALMARFNEVAAQNPYSWFPDRRRADDIMKVDADNRIIYYPYPKYMNAVMDVDMGAAVILTDAATARAWGLGPDEVVYVSGWADAHDLWYLSERPAVDRSSALEVCARVALEAAGARADEVSAFDLYSCFPSSIEVARDAVGIPRDDTRPLTLTGGLPYHGGPGSNYVTHAIVNAFDWLRDGRGDSVLVHGNGYYLTKHAIGVYTRHAPDPARPVPDEAQALANGTVEAVPIDAGAGGTGTVLAYTAQFGRDGHAGPAIVLAEVGGRRTVASADPGLTSELLEADGVGTKITISPSSEGNSALRV